MLTCTTLVCIVREGFGNFLDNCLQTKLLRKPYMGNLYVRFDEGEGSALGRPSLLYRLCESGSSLPISMARQGAKGISIRDRLPGAVPRKGRDTRSNLGFSATTENHWGRKHAFGDRKVTFINELLGIS